MSGASTAHADARAVSRALRRVYWKLMVRGTAARQQPKPYEAKGSGRFVATFVAYAALGSMLGVTVLSGDRFAASLMLHGANLMMVSLMLATTAGDSLFHRQESEILLHRPVRGEVILTAKLQVWCTLALATATSFTAVPLAIACFRRELGVAWVAAHLLASLVLVIFAASAVVVAYQLGARWAGRERLDRMMTWLQVGLSMTMMVGAQVAPRVVLLARGEGTPVTSPWVWMLPPGWFACLDEIVLEPTARSAALGPALLGIVSTAALAWLALGRLARHYEEALAFSAESRGEAPRAASGVRFSRRITTWPGIATWLADPVERGAFSLTLAYLGRDRSVRLRVLPAMGSFLVMPVAMFASTRGAMDDGIVFPLGIVSAFLPMMPLQVLQLLPYTDHPDAAALFRFSPIARPAQLFHGARKAVLLVCGVVPVAVGAALLVALTGRVRECALLLSGAVLMPPLSLVPAALDTWVPFAKSIEGMRRDGRAGVLNLVVVFGCVLLGIAGSFAWKSGWYAPMLGVEAVGALIAWVWLSRAVAEGGWDDDGA